MTKAAVSTKLTPVHRSQTHQQLTHSRHSPATGSRDRGAVVSPVGAFALVVIISLVCADRVVAELRAGASKVDITNVDAGPVNDPLYAKALVVSDGTTTVVIATVDAVALAEIGPIRNDFMSKVRAGLKRDLDMNPQHVLVNASHCHGIVCADVAERTVQAVTQAAGDMVPVTVGAGVGHEDRIMENRRLKLKSGREVDVRQAYSLPADEEVASVGPVDPEIGVLRLDREDGRTLAVVYNFACHPIQGVPSGGNSADLTGFASQVIEDHSSEGTIAIFLQGCAGDINPAMYKDVNRPRDAEPLGNLLGLSTLKAARKVRCQAGARLEVLNQVIELPRADTGQRIIALQAQQQQLLRSLRGTFLNLKSFLPLAVKYGLSSEFPAHDSHRYLHEQAMGRNDLNHLDRTNRRHLQQYIRNVRTMEQLTRININLALLRKHQANNLAAPKRTVDVELVGLRIGEFVLVTFPGELTVQIGLNIKRESPHELTFVAGYTNGYIYYAPTAEQLRNVGGAQEDSECILAPPWQAIFESKAAEMISQL